jgi:probable rRNA maturation factor
VTDDAPSRIFGADEQDAVAIDVMRWVGLAQLVLTEERTAPDMELALIFVDEQAIADLNERFLDHPGPTDVLAFPLDEPPPPGGRRPDQGGRGPGGVEASDEPPLILGDVLVCPAVARRQAEAIGRDLDDELALLVVHGVLHLLDYDHADPADAARMQQRERELLVRHAETSAATAVADTDGAVADTDGRSSE